MAVLALSIASFLTFSLGLLCVQHPRMATFFPQFIALGTGGLLVTCMTKFLPSIDWGGAHEAQQAALGHEHSFLPASFFMLMGVLLVVVADKYVAPYVLRRSSASLDPTSLDSTGLDSAGLDSTGLDPAGQKLVGQDCHEHHHSQHGSFFIQQGAACSSIGCIVVCAFFDGFEIVAAFNIQNSTGWFVNAALLLHTIPEAVMAASLGGSAIACSATHSATAGSAIARSAIARSSKNMYTSIGLVSAAIWLGGISMLSASKWIAPEGATFEGVAPEWLTRESVLLPLATGVLLYTLLSHLLPAALKAPYAWICLFLGGSLALFI